MKKVVELQMLVAESQVGERSVIKVLRQGHERILNVTIGEMPPELAGQTVEIKSVAWEILGLSVRKLQAGDFERYTYLTDEDQGVIVEMVKVDAPGYKARIPNGALIVAINDQKVTNVQAFEAFLQAKQGAEELILDIKSSHGEERLTVKLGN